MGGDMETDTERLAREHAELREYWSVLIDAWGQLSEELPSMDDAQREKARQYMKELAEEIPGKFRAFLGGRINGT